MATATESRRRRLEFRLESAERSLTLLQRALTHAPRSDAPTAQAEANRDALERQTRRMEETRDAIRAELRNEPPAGSVDVADLARDIAEQRPPAARPAAPLEPHADWVARAFRDPGFEVCRDRAPDARTGDCLYGLFAVALGTTVAHLRALVAQSATAEEFATKQALYEDAKHNYGVLLDRLQRTPRNTRTYVSLYDAVQKAAADRQNYRWLEGVRDVDGFRRALASDERAWGDGESLGKLQQRTATRAVLVSRRLTQENQGHAALYPSSALVPDGWQPQRWILGAYDEDGGGHFDLLSYHGRRIFERQDEVPFSVRRLLGVS